MDIDCDVCLNRLSEDGGLCDSIGEPCPGCGFKRDKYAHLLLEEVLEFAGT